MQNINKEQIEILVKLQDVEIEKERVQAKVAKVSQQYENLDSQISKLERNVADEDERLQSLKKDYRDYDADLQSSNAQIGKSKEKMRSVKNNKEYQSILKEIEDIESKNAKLEDEMLECLEKIDAGETRIQSHKEHNINRLKEIQDEKEDINRDSLADKKKLAQLQADMAQVTDTVQQRLLKTFLMVKERQTNGVSIVPVSDAICQGCNLNIPPQMYNELQRFDSLKFCPNCQRIIYWKSATADNA